MSRCPDTSILSPFSYDRLTGTAEAQLFSMFKFPESNRVHFQCDILICQVIIVLIIITIIIINIIIIIIITIIIIILRASAPRLSAGPAPRPGPWCSPEPRTLTLTTP